MKTKKSTIAIIAVVLTVGIAALGSAHEGYGPGYGGHMMGYRGGHGYMGPGMMGWGPGYGHMRGYYGRDAYGDLSKEDATKLEQSQEKFCATPYATNRSRSTMSFRRTIRTGPRWPTCRSS